MQNWFKSGDHNAICDSCGRKYKASTMQMRWDGLFVCPEDYEVRHPQLSLRVHADKQSVAISRPEPETDTFVEICYIWSSAPYADMATAGCAVTGNTTLSYASLRALQSGI